MTKFELVIFDCDGVLVDSERISNQIFADMLNELGVPATLDYMFDHFFGHSMRHCMGLVATLLGRLPPADFADRYRERLKLAFVAELKAVDGIEAALNRINLPFCVASSGDHDKMRTTLGITGLLPRFDGKLFSVTEVSNGKPWPDIFLHAAKVHGVLPSACVVVEDSPTGVTAAVAAGMTVLGYAGLTPAVRLRSAGAHRTFSRMGELPSLVDSGIRYDTAFSGSATG
jgi:HAD superfamily hydrolase (TIGR01509 family)